MYNVASCNHCCTKNATMRYVYGWATCHCQHCYIIEYVTKIISWFFYVTGNNKPRLGLNVKCPICLSDFSQIWSLWTDFHKSPQYKTSQKFVRWESRWYMWIEQTDKRTNMASLIGAFCDWRTCPVMWTVSEFCTHIWIHLSQNILCQYPQEFSTINIRFVFRRSAKSKYAAKMPLLKLIFIQFRFRD